MSRLISNVSRTLWAEPAFPYLAERIVSRRDAYILAFSWLKDLWSAVRMSDYVRERTPAVPQRCVPAFSLLEERKPQAMPVVGGWFHPSGLK